MKRQSRGERLLRQAVMDFALRYSLETKVRWTTTGLAIEFVEPQQGQRNRRFMRVTIGPIEVMRFNALSYDLVMVQWTETWVVRPKA